MIEKQEYLPWTTDVRHRAGILFRAAMWYGIQYTEQDLEWIEKKEKTDKIVALVQQYKFEYKFGHETYQDFYKDRIQLVVMEKLLDDPDIPKNIKNYLWYRVGEKRSCAKLNAEYLAEKAKNGESLPYYDLPLHEYFIKRWMETCY